MLQRAVLAPVARVSARRGRATLAACIVGGGPAGYYVAHRLLRLHPDARVDLIEQLPVPFGLVRYGVAPDHPEVTNVTVTFEQVHKDPRFRLFANLTVGRDVSVAELRRHYAAVVLAYGAAADRMLGIPGEAGGRGLHAARDFVGWYNGHPAQAHEQQQQQQWDLMRSDTCAIIGHGNVALDCARMLLKSPDALRRTDMAPYALAALSRSDSSRIRRVLLIGRRGPLEASFTIKELREMTTLPDCRIEIDARDVALSSDAERAFVAASRPHRRLLELMQRHASTPSSWPDPAVGRAWRLVFCRRPVAVHRDPDSGYVTGLVLERTVLDGTLPSAPQQQQQQQQPVEQPTPMPLSPPQQSTRHVHGTGELELLPCGLILRSIGYRAVPLANTLETDVPFDGDAHIVRNDDGRVTDAQGRRIRGLYCAGWVRTGPRGTIASTMQDAYTVAEHIVADDRSGALPDATDGADLCAALANAQQQQQQQRCGVVTVAGWRAIDAYERERARIAGLGQPRQKITDVQEMLHIAAQA